MRLRPLTNKSGIKSYIGQPLFHEDGSLFGTLCAIDPQTKSEAIIQEVELIELFGNLLSNILQAELRQNEQIRQCERLEAEALRDGLTGLYNRRAWEQLVNAEVERCKRYGHPTAVFLSI